MLDRDTRETLQSWAELDFDYKNYLAEDKLIQASLSPGPLEQLSAERLFGKMKGRKKRAAKRARIEPPRAPTPELKQPADAPPVIDLEDSKNLPPWEPETIVEPVPETTAEPAPKTTVEPAPMPETTSGSEGTARSILNP
ncbi:PREDICTED: procyclic form-specific polypeptide B1-alpha-like [Nelumbo nucifera]|uniref:Procyclic form-specific polypeptide B1-alpha-like n=1 Tax=Nelumbo nucifera TaxID=4432 RepID=A0A1U7ZLV1_NELNU|nr:PREDICTED: procyclic form-specific polypeptide B1-alpha-like [Nelumbo nucifera]